MNCPYCRKPLPKGAEICPNCKAAVPKPKKSETKEKVNNG